MTKTFAEFMLHGIFVSESITREVPSRDPATIDKPEHAYAVRFFDRESATLDGEELLGKPKNWSRYFFFGGERFNFEEATAFFPKERILLANMECNKHDVWRSPGGRFYLWTEGDEIV